MNRTARAQRLEIVQPEFREIVCLGKPSLFVLIQKADHRKSMRILDDNDLKPLFHQVALMYSLELLAEFKRKNFYLADKGLTERGLNTFEDQGKIIEITGKGQIPIPPERQIFLYPGDQQLILWVAYDYILPKGFGLSADEGPGTLASAIVGLRKDAPPPSTLLRRKRNDQATLLFGEIREDIANIRGNLAELEGMLRVKMKRAQPQREKTRE